MNKKIILKGKGDIRARLWINTTDEFKAARRRWTATKEKGKNALVVKWWIFRLDYSRKKVLDRVDI
jgi:hypothetical protein